MGNMGVRTRIITASVALVALVLGLLSWLIWREMSAGLMATVRSTAEGQSAVIASDLSRESPQLAVPMDVQPASHRVQQIVAADGTVLATSRSAVKQPIIVISLLPEGETRSLISPVDPWDQAEFVVVVRGARLTTGESVNVLVGEPAHLEYRAVSRLALSILAITGLTFGLLVIVIGFGVSEALRPVEDMRARLDTITSSGSQARVVVPPGNDEITRLGRTMNRLLDRLGNSDREQRMFVANAGHELRSPLTTIGLSVERLSQELPAAERTQVAGRAEHEVRRLGQLVSDLLVLATGDEGRSRALTDVDLDDVVYQEIEAAKIKDPQAKEPTIELYVEPVRIVGDADQLGRVVRNLVENGMRHARELVVVSLSAPRAPGAPVVLHVDNDGEPVPEADRERVFQRFVRLDDSRWRGSGGTGLGLAIVDQIVRTHGGTVATTESPTGGCRFTVTLPLDVDVAADVDEDAGGGDGGSGAD